jgi:hypothetical protein
MLQNGEHVIKASEWNSVFFRTDFNLFTFVVNRALHIHMNKCAHEDTESIIIDILHSAPGDFASCLTFAQSWFELLD